MACEFPKGYRLILFISAHLTQFSGPCVKLHITRIVVGIKRITGSPALEYNGDGCLASSNTNESFGGLLA